MPGCTCPISWYQGRPFLLVPVTVRPLHRRGVPVNAWGILDTGATTSGITPRAALIGRFTAGSGRFSRMGVDGESNVLGYRGYLHLNDTNMDHGPMTMLTSHVEFDPHWPTSRQVIALVGLDVLQYYRLTYDGPRRTFSLEW